MFNFKHRSKKQYDGGGLGMLYFNNAGNIKSWDTSFKSPGLFVPVEVSIETSTDAPPAADCIKSMEQFLSSYDQLKPKLLHHIYNAYLQSEYALSIEHLDKMYFLAGITLKLNGDWWVVLEPADVDSVYNHFIRFTIRDGNIVWANVNE